MEALAYLIPLCVCSVVSTALMLLFRDELKRFLRESFCSMVMHACIGKEVLKDFLNERRNTVETVSMPGDVVVITGSRGIGFEVIKKLLQSEMTVIIGCRDLAVGEESVSNIRSSGVTTGTTFLYHLDLTSMTSVKDFAEEVLKFHPSLHVLVNNAGVTLKSRSLTKDGVETTFSTNYLGHFYLTHLLLTRLAETAGTTGARRGRIVNVASVAHNFPYLACVHFEDLTLGEKYEEYTAYCQSKLSQVMFATTLSSKISAHNSRFPVGVISVHPGIVDTGLVSKSIAHKLGGCLFPKILRSAEEGARSIYYACVSPELESRGGAYVYSCSVTPPGKTVQSEEAQERLWKMTMDMLGLKTFGDVLPSNV